MSDQPFGNMPPGPNPWTPQGAIPAQKPSRIPLIVVGVIAVLGLGLAAASWLRPTHAEAAAGPQYSEQQVAEAKKNICNAYGKSVKAINTAGSLNSDDLNQKFMLSLHTRLAFIAASSYLDDQVAANNAAPSNLIDQVRALVMSYEEMVLAHTSQAPKQDLDKIYDKTDSYESAIKQACG